MYKVNKKRIAVILTGSALSALILSVGISQAIVVRFLGPPVSSGSAARNAAAASGTTYTYTNTSIPTPIDTTATTTTATTTTATLFSGGTTATSLSPTSGPAGTQVTITGSGFTPTGNKVKFGNLGSEDNPSYSLNSSDGTTLVFAVPLSNYASCWFLTRFKCYRPIKLTQPGIYPVSVINASGTSNAIDFTVIGPPISSGSGTTATSLPANPNFSDIQSSLNDVGQRIDDVKSDLNSPNAPGQMKQLIDQIAQVQQAIGGQVSPQPSTSQASTPVAPQSAIPPSGSYTKSISQGYRGNDVAALQQFLKTQGVDVYPEGLVTGYFGPSTRKAVGRFQLQNGIVKSARDPGYGYLGPKTRAQINSLLGL